MASAISSAAKYALVAALAAAGMYWFDPRLGRRRRARIRDKLVSGLTQARRATGQQLHDTRTRSLIRSIDVSDDVLLERVRAAVGRATSRSSSIEVSCSAGVVTLKGTVLKHEHPRVMRAARSAGGVGEVHDELAAYKPPSSPSQGPGVIASP